MKLSIDPKVISLYPNLKVGFAIVRNLLGYGSIEEAQDAEKTILNLVKSTYENELELDENYLKECYNEFYRKMNLKPSKVSTPLKQVKRIIKRDSYHSLYKIIDKYLSAEYKTLVSFQAYDIEKIVGSVFYTLAEGNEDIFTLHKEDKLCKTGELVLKNNETIMHSSYYGNHLSFSVNEKSRNFLVRFLGVPGIREEDFNQAKELVSKFNNNVEIVILDATNQSTDIKL